MAGIAARGSGRPFQPFFRIIRNTKSVRGAEQMIRYVAFRSRDLDGKEKGAFDRDHDHADVKEFVERIPDRLTRHERAPKAFHCLFSLPREEFERVGLQDWRQVVRDVMARYERESGRRLEWIAANHDNPTHPHCHVIIKAVYEKETGERHKLRFDRADLKLLRQITGRELAYHREQVRADERVNGRMIEPDRAVRTVGSLLRTLQQMLEEERRRQWEAERERDRWLRDEEERER